jgi:hypothetical protein
MDESEAREIAAKLIRKFPLNDFPGDFLPEGYPGRDFSVHEFRDLSMYRELEGVNLFIDGERIFFSSIQQAKFARICLISGKLNFRIPDDQDSKMAVRHYRQYLDSIYGDFVKAAVESGLDEKTSEAVAEKCIEILNGEDDMSSE